MSSVNTLPARRRPWRTDEWVKEPPASLFRLQFAEVWTFFRKQPASFWFVCLYMFFEYVRPQGIYDVLSGKPLPLVSILLCVVALVLEGRRLPKPTFVEWLLAFFTFVILLSSALSYFPVTAFGEFRGIYFGWVISYVLITTAVDNERKFVIFMALYFLWCFKMSQHGTRSFVERGFAFASYGVTCAPQFFNNSGECGIQMAMFLPSSLYFFLGLQAYLSRGKKWLVALLPITAGLTIVGSSSRGAQLALAAILLWMVLRNRHPFRMLFISAVAAVAFYSVLPPEQIERFRSMGTDETSMTRRQYWSDGIRMMNEHPVLGIGFQNWLEYYPREYGRYQLPHNIFVEAGAELGYTGLIAFLMLIVGTFVLNARTRKLARQLPRGNFHWHMAHGLDGALIGYLVGGFFVTVLYYPFFWINLAMTAALYNVTRKAHANARRTLARPPGASVPAMGGNAA